MRRLPQRELEAGRPGFGAGRLSVSPMRSVRRELVGPFVLALMAFSTATTQGVRVNGVSSGWFIQLRPFVLDSVPRSVVVDSSGVLYRTADGLTVTCVPGRAFCQYYRSGDAFSSVPLTQDFDVTSWGFGTGLSAHALLRFRAAMGDQQKVWPRNNDRFDALTAYVEADRPQWRARVGRQYESSALGYRNYDGASALWRPTDALAVQGYGGWGLAQALNAPITSDDITRYNDLPPDVRGLVFGGTVRYRPSYRTGVIAEYRRDIMADFAWLYSDRVSLTAAQALGNGSSLDGVLVYDLAAGVLNDGRLRGSVALPHRSSIALELRHYQPFFELWTIWGAFAPVGYQEARGNAAWASNNDDLSVDFYGGWRRYEDTHVAGFAPEPILGSGWDVGINGTWRPNSFWTANASYAAEIGYGASRNDADASVTWQSSAELFVGARLAAYQTIYEFRVGTGRVFGAGLDAGWRFRPDVRLVGNVSLYHQQTTNAGPTTDWSQRRAMVRLEWTVGADPGLSALAEKAR